jgi:hypothetical protein
MTEDTKAKLWTAAIAGIMSVLVAWGPALVGTAKPSAPPSAQLQINGGMTCLTAGATTLCIADKGGAPK